MEATANAPAAKMELGDYLKECELWRYSKEYFGLLKEASELALMEEHMLVLEALFEDEDLAAYGEGTLMVESTDTYESVYSLYEEKSGGFMASVKSGLKTLWNAFINVLKRIVNVFTGGQEKEIARLREEMAGMAQDLDDARYDAATAKADNVKAKADAGLIQAWHNAKIDAFEGKIHELRGYIDKKEKETDAQDKRINELKASHGRANRMIRVLKGRETIVPTAVQKKVPKAAVVNGYLATNIVIEAPAILFNCKPFLLDAARHIEDYTNTRDGKGRVKAITALNRRISDALNKTQTSNWSIKEAQEMLTMIESKKESLFGALDMLGNMSRDATTVNDQQRKDGVPVGKDKDKAEKMMGKEWKGDGMFDLGGKSGAHGEILKLISNLKLATNLVITALTDFTQKRTLAIKVTNTIIKQVRTKTVAA